MCCDYHLIGRCLIFTLVQCNRIRSLTEMQFVALCNGLTIFDLPENLPGLSFSLDKTVQNCITDSTEQGCEAC